ncbi:MAG TPA: hypothetical protein DF292_10045 [Firmicutes bacterium]|jgi:hypothetical protein|nr:hypothetical protein [Bacillota bacterium]HBL67718.1 hypothetical protein [Bacillota bacterium]HBR24818.1 hypothetical protein [Bacillota bacterium]HCF91106.1 hypothetical protein [Bacillota bacterium]HCT37355.1 hypothetical protein [Bacillota bacterium]
MFNQKPNVFERINTKPFEGALYFLVLSALTLLGLSIKSRAGSLVTSLVMIWPAFLTITYLIRYILFPGCRKKIWFGMLFLTSLTVGALLSWSSIYHCAYWLEGFAKGLLVFLTALLLAYNMEVLIALRSQYFDKPYPWGNRYDTFAGRRNIAAMAAADAGRLALACAMLGTLGLCWMSIYFEFDFFAYSYVLVLLTVLLYCFLLAGVTRRLKTGIAHDLTSLNDNLEATYERVLRSGFGSQEAVEPFRINTAMQEWLAASGRVAVPWEHLLTLIVALLLILAAPYVIYIVGSL